MKRIAILPRAEEDMAQIWRYTDDHWGTAQADLYINEIDRLFKDLAAGIRSGRNANTVRAGFRRHLIGSHIVFYR